MPRSIVHVLLSLLLLLAQQASILHVAMDSGAGRARGGAAPAVSQDAGVKPGKLLGGGVHDACALCMDSAQLAFALPLPVSGFLPLSLAFDAPAGACNAGVHLVAHCVVQPRGPPQT